MTVQFFVNSYGCFFTAGEGQPCPFAVVATSDLISPIQIYVRIGVLPPADKLFMIACDPSF